MEVLEWILKTFGGRITKYNKNRLEMRGTISRTGSCGPIKQPPHILEVREKPRHQMTQPNSRFKKHTYTNHFK